MSQQKELDVNELDALVSEDFKSFFLDLSQGNNGSSKETDHFLLIHSGAKAYNAAYVLPTIKFADKESIMRELELAVQFFNDRDSTFTLYVADIDLGPEKERIYQIFHSEGWIGKADLVNMGRNLENFSIEILNEPEGLVIEEVLDQNELHIFTTTVASEFLFHPYEAPHVEDVALSLKTLDKSCWFLYVAKLNDEIVGTISLAQNHPDLSIGSIHMVVVKEGFRKRGYGSMMMKFILNLSKLKGVEYCLLQAEPDGVNLYKRHEFCEYGRIGVFLPPVANNFVENRH